VRVIERARDLAKIRRRDSLTQAKGRVAVGKATRAFGSVEALFGNGRGYLTVNDQAAATYGLFMKREADSNHRQ
jgi:hypothetical protein